MKAFDKLLRIGEGKIVRRLEGIAKLVNSIEDDFVNMTDEELRGQTADFKQRVDNGESLDALLPEAFAVVREAAKRTLHQRHYDVQVMGGAALHLGNIAEMKTGEGKTLTSVLPAYLNALSGNGVHLVTVNDYLAKRDAENMGRIHRFLGVSVGVILSEMTPAVRREQYAADINRLALVTSYAGTNFNQGLRAYYFALAAMTWFLHPYLMMIATAWVVYVLYHREFESRTLYALIGNDTSPQIKT